MNRFGTASQVNTCIGGASTQVVEEFGGPGRVRTVDLFHAMEGRPLQPCGATVQLADNTTPATASLVGRDHAGVGVDADTRSARVPRAIIPGYGLPEQDAQSNALPRVAGSEPARQHTKTANRVGSESDQVLSRKPLCIDIFCGLGGWTEGFLAEGYDVVGFDIERHQYGDQKYPAQLVLQDVLTLRGSQFRNAAVIVASPPCQAYSYMAMPWSRAKELVRQHEADVTRQLELNCLFNACFRIAHEAGVPLVVENVKGAQKWVGRAAWHYGSFYLWGDVPALMPSARVLKANPDGTNHGVGSWFAIADSKNRGAPIKNNGGSWFAIGSPGQMNTGQNPDGRKVPGLNWSGSHEPGYKAQAFNDTAVARFGWRDSVMDKGTSKGSARKAASAQIAKIPFPLASWIARCFKPEVLHHA